MFVNFCHGLNRLHLSGVAAGLRWVAFHILPRREEPYDDQPGGVVELGYQSWVDVPALGCVAFRRTDGSLQFRW